MIHPVVRIARNITALVLREGCSKGIYFALSVLIARRYGKDILGQYVLAFLVPRLFFMISEMGLNTLLTREVAKSKQELSTYVVNFSYLKTLLGMVTLLVIAGTARLLYPSGPLFFLISLISLSYLVMSYLYLLNAAFRAFEKMGYEARVFILRDLLFLFFAFLWLWKRQDLSLLFLFFLAANIVALGYGLWLYRRLFGPPAASLDLAFCRKTLQGTKPIWLIYLLSIFYLYNNSVMLSVLKGEAVVGLYNAAFMFVELFILSSMILTTVFFPIFSREAHNPQELQRAYQAVLKFSLFCFFPFQICFLIFAPQWLVFFFGPSFSEVAGGLRLLMASAAFFVMGSVNTHCLIACGEEVFVAKAMALFLLLNMVLNLWWIPPFSFIGSSLATALCEGLVFLTFFTRIRSHRGAMFLGPFLGKLLLAGAVMAAYSLFFSRSLFFPLGLLTGFALYLLADLLMRGYLWQERRKIKTLWLEYGART